MTAPAVGLAAAVLLAALGMAVPAILDWNVHVMSFPPLHADWDPRVGPGTLPAVLVAALAAWQAVPLAERLPWRRLLLVAFVAGLAWLLALAFVDGRNGIGVILGTQYEYLRSARRITDIPQLLHEYVARIPFSAPDNWPVHLAGHPPGAVLFFIGLVHLGLGSGFHAGLVVTVLAATTAVAVLVTMRLLGAEAAARRAAPFLVLGPAAIWQSVSADAMFAAIAAWGIASLAMAATRQRHLTMAGWAIGAGLLLGYCVMLSYGLPIIGILALAVLWLAHSWRPLPYAVVAAAGVVLAFAAGGFVWWEALPALHDRYWAGVASRRPAAYWIWGDFAALVFSAGPLVGAGVAQAVARVRDTSARVPATLALSGLGMALLADASQMSKAEVERIWLPFVPWLLVGCALLPRRWRTCGLVIQLVVALLVQHLLATGW
jgi:hypothetical protein